MKSKAAWFTQILILISLSVLSVFSQAERGLSATPQKPQVPASSQGILRVSEGKSFVLNSNDPIKRISVTNDQIATAIVISPNQILIHGLKAGTISLLMWDEQEHAQAFDLQVVSVPMNLDPLRTTLSKVLPGQDIRVSQSGSSIVLTGTVSSAAVADQAASVAKTETLNVVNLLAVPPPATKLVMLEVKFAEVQRNAVQQLGLNILSTGALNTPGVISTQQFPAPTLSSVKSSIGNSLRGFSTEAQLSDILNLFVFRPDLNLGLLIKALQQQSLLESLAEPNLLALGGKEASFLAGGEFPVPVIQGGTGTPTVSILFKEFGVRLKFVANPDADGNINLHVAPEVSSLDFANAVTLSGFLIPALITRRAETDVQLKDGQSFAIAGLLDNRVTKVDNKIKWLGDVPILGNLFKSQNFAKAKSELLVMVTPHIVKPLEAGQPVPIPQFPVPFLGAEPGKAGASENQKSKP